ncbi:MAG: DegV family protein [Oscillospiraceae bacterium]|nr:DegV family protein [Oscillospiraceae bacterium]
MVRIVSDTSTLYGTRQAAQAGFSVSPLSVTVDGHTYREFDEIGAEEFTDIIRQGHIPASSQPAVGEVLALYEQYAQDEVLNITMADGLSGTYASAAAAAEMCENKHKVIVLNSRTLCGPHRYLVEQAAKLAAQGERLEHIVRRVRELMATAKSYLIPADFAYLRRGGRLSALVSYVGQATKFAPVLTQTEGGERLTIAGVRRSFDHAVRYVGDALIKHGVGEGWRVYITHGAAPHLAEKALAKLKEVFPTAVFQVLPLSPVFITQGGPDCVAIQAIHE